MNYHKYTIAECSRLRAEINASTSPKKTIKIIARELGVSSSAVVSKYNRIVGKRGLKGFIKPEPRGEAVGPRWSKAEVKSKSKVLKGVNPTSVTVKVGDASVTFSYV